jgi:hypothetical protein
VQSLTDEVVVAKRDLPSLVYARRIRTTTKIARTPSPAHRCQSVSGSDLWVPRTHPPNSRMEGRTLAV